MSLSIAVLALVTLQRLSELVLARRNTQRLLAGGAIEVGARHYPLIVALHGAWLASLWYLGWDRLVVLPWLAVFLILQGLRLWVLWTLKDRWTTRIIVLPGAPLVREGPYRYMSHPNYAIVAAEIATLPLALGLYWCALIFSVANGIVLTTRLRAESSALALAAPVPGPAACAPSRLCEPRSSRDR